MFAYGYLFFYIPYSKNISGKSFGEFGKSQHFAKFFANFDYFHNIPYANGLQFAKVFSAKLPTVLIRQPFLLPKFLLYGSFFTFDPYFLFKIANYSFSSFFMPT